MCTQMAKKTVQEYIYNDRYNHPLCVCTYVHIYVYANECPYTTFLCKLN